MIDNFIKDDLKCGTLEQSKTKVINLWKSLLDSDKENLKLFTDTDTVFGQPDFNFFADIVKNIKQEYWDRFVNLTYDAYSLLMYNEITSTNVTLPLAISFNIISILNESNLVAQQEMLKIVKDTPVYRKVRNIKHPKFNNTCLFNNICEIHEMMRELYSVTLDNELNELFEPIINQEINKKTIYDSLLIQNYIDIQYLLKKVKYYQIDFYMHNEDNALKLRDRFYFKLLELINSDERIEIKDSLL